MNRVFEIFVDGCKAGEVFATSADEAVMVWLNNHIVVKGTVKAEEKPCTKW